MPGIKAFDLDSGEYAQQRINGRALIRIKFTKNVGCYVNDLTLYITHFKEIFHALKKQIRARH